MGHRADDAPILNDRASRHALHDAAGARDQRFIGHMHNDGAHGLATLGLQVFNLAVIGAHAVVHCGQNLRGAHMHLAAQADGQAIGIERIAHVSGIILAVDAVIAVHGDFTNLLFVRQEVAHDLPGRSALAPAHLHHAALVEPAVCHGQRDARIHVRNGVAQRAERTRFRIHEGQRAHASGAGAHPGADAQIAVPGIRHGRESERLLRVTAHHGDRRGLPRLQQLRQILGRAHVASVDPSNYIT